MGKIQNTKRILRDIIKHQNEFRCTIDLSKDLTLKFWERPGQWCNQEELNSLVEDLRTIVKNSDDGKDSPEYGVLMGDVEDLKKRIITIIYSKDGTPLAFSAKVYIDLLIGVKKINVLHLGLAFVSKEARGKNLTSLIYSFPSLIILLKNAFRKQWISNVTQVPAVFGLVQDFYSNSYPTCNGAVQDYKHKVISKKIFDNGKHFFGVGEEAVFEEQKQIIRNSYTGGSDNLKKTFEESTPYREDPRVNAYMQSNLDYARGDDVLQLAELDIWLLIRVVRSKAIRNNFSNLFFNLFIFLFIAIFLPYLRWLMPQDEE